MSNASRQQSADAEHVWRRIVNHAGETFHQVRGKPFTYDARGRTIYLHTTNRMISRTAVEKALDRWPLERVSDLQDLSAPSYLFAILSDGRVVPATTGERHSRPTSEPCP